MLIVVKPSIFKDTAVTTEAKKKKKADRQSTVVESSGIQAQFPSRSINPFGDYLGSSKFVLFQAR